MQIASRLLQVLRCMEANAPLCTMGSQLCALASCWCCTALYVEDGGFCFVQHCTVTADANVAICGLKVMQCCKEALKIFSNLGCHLLSVGW
jgi:hypothetical protein